MQMLWPDERVVMLRTGIMVCAETVHEAFDAMYYLEQAARVTVKAMSTGRPLKIVPDAVSTLWRQYCFVTMC